jgi:peptide/nickel transport system permease protein
MTGAPVRRTPVRRTRTAAVAKTSAAAEIAMRDPAMDIPAILAPEGIVPEAAIPAGAGTYDELENAPEIGFWRLAMERFLHHRTATVSLAILAVIVASALVLPLVQGDLYRVQDYRHPYGAPLHLVSSPPFLAGDWHHPLGTDDLGRDELARLARGARVSLTVGIAAMIGYLVIGGILGAVAGYFGGWLDNVLMRITDIIIATPFFLTVIAVSAAFGGVSLFKIIVIIAALGWVEIARLMRSQFLSLRESEYVQAARALGASDWRIISRHILPNALTPIIISATLGVSGIILLEAALGFLGYSIPSPEPSWGNMISSFEDALLKEHYYLFIFPCVALITTALCINLVGDGIRDALDPRQR